MTLIVQRLRDVLIRAGLSNSEAEWNPLAGGRSNHTWRVQNENGSLICKLFSDMTPNPLYPNFPGVEYEILRSFSARNISPEPIALIRTEYGDVLVYQYLDGRNWSSGAAEVARLLGYVHDQNLRIGLRRIGSGSDSLIRQTERILALCQNAFLLDLFGKTPGMRAAPINNACLVHTDVVPGNLIATVHGLRLIDWQCPAFGDPCEDLASFLSPAMQYLYRGRVLSESEKTAFLTAYPRPEVVRRYRKLAPLFHLRMAAYCQWKLETGARDYAAARDRELAELEQADANYEKTG